MSKLLVITAHPLDTKHSRTLQLKEDFLNAYREIHPDDFITELDLFQSFTPQIDTDVMTGWNQLNDGADFTSLSAEQQKKIARLNELLAQFKTADKIILANPMWNLSFPPVVKAYIDALIVKGETFTYTNEGPVGLLTGKKFLHIQSNGGTYTGQDYGSQYIRGIFGFIGIDDFSELFVEGIDYAPEQAESITKKAQLAALELAQNF